MDELTRDIDLTLAQAAAIARAMQEVAETDGLHEREAALIDSFYQSCARESGAPLEPGQYDPAIARVALQTAEHRALAVRSCYLLALADGAISASEEACIARIAADLGVDDATRAACAREAKVSLLAQFKGVSVFRAMAEDIGRSLGLDQATLDDALKP